MAARFAKNFLPILFNHYLQSNTNVKHTASDDVEMRNANEATHGNTDSKKSPDRLAALETIRLYFKITDKDLLKQ